MTAPTYTAIRPVVPMPTTKGMALRKMTALKKRSIARSITIVGRISLNDIPERRLSVKARPISPRRKGRKLFSR